MHGKTCLITGASSGIGEATALELARRGANVALVARQPHRGERARERIRRATGRAPHLFVADLSTRDAVRELARAGKEHFSRLDVLVNNAGVLTRRRHLTPEGFELQFFVNHLAGFLLTNLLLDLLMESAPARIVNIASTAHSRGVLDFEDLQGAKSYRGWQMYANTKLANIVFTYELARRLEGTRVTANCVHPGVVATGLVRSYSRALNRLVPLARLFLKSPRQGARTPTYVASAPELESVSGRYFKDCRPIGTSRLSYDREIQRRLWEVSERLLDLDSAVV